MENISDNFVVWVGYFFLMVLRISAIFIVSPVFGRKNLPNIAKIGLSILIAYISISVFPPDNSQNYNNIAQYVLTCIKELSLGLIIGMITTLFFATVHTAGQLIDMEIGFGFSQVFEVQSNSQVPITGSLMQAVLLICFFLADGHLLLIRLISDTFRVIPVGQVVIRPQIVSIFTEIFITTFVMSLKIAMPILAASLLTEVMLGIMMRAIPQMNFFVVGIPIKLIMGLIILLMFISVFVHASNSIFENMMDAIKRIFEGMVPQ